MATVLPFSLRRAGSLACLTAASAASSSAAAVAAGSSAPPPRPRQLGQPAPPVHPGPAREQGPSDQPDCVRRPSTKRRRSNEVGEVVAGRSVSSPSRRVAGAAEELSESTAALSTGPAIPPTSARLPHPAATSLSPTPRPRPIPLSRASRAPRLHARPRTALSPLSSPLYATTAPKRLEARGFLTFRTARKPAAEERTGGESTAGAPPPGLVGASPATDGVREGGERASGRRGEGQAGKAASSAAGQPAATGEARPRRSMSPPRPASPYGEINALVRHPLLYDPVLKPRFPIVLCHGLYGFDVRGPGFFRLHYWGDMLKILRGKIGAEVFVTAVPGTGSVKNRAQVLNKALNETPALLNRDVNFVAHSMGGLDARYLISNIRPTLYKPRSLTTLCTPHRGSEFMAWCRANIGIGTEFDQNEPLDLRPSTSSSLDEPDDSSIPLPYSLKSPILSREQVEAGKRAAQATKTAEKVKAAATSSILPFNLSTSVTSYLLDLLDSPAYANLTPSFLRDAFNPSTPDRDDVKYYSIAARSGPIAIWHPLWLPKLVLDGAEAARVASGVAAPPEWRGNDGLVSIDSARWGEFLGTFDACDHWEMRGSSGLSSAEASKHAVEQVKRSEIRETDEPKEGKKAQKVEGGNGKGDKGWQWQDVYASVAMIVGGGSEKGQSAKAKKEGNGEGEAQAQGTPSAKQDKEAKKDDSSDAEGLASAASWIIRQLPGTSVGDASSAGSSTPSAISNAASTVSSTVTSTASTAASSATSAAHIVVDNVVNNRAARLLYGAPGLSSSASSHESDQAERKAAGVPLEAKPHKPEKFSLERMTIALCRKLHNDGF